MTFSLEPCISKKKTEKVTTSVVFVLVISKQTQIKTNENKFLKTNAEQNKWSFVLAQMNVPEQMKTWTNSSFRRNECSRTNEIPEQTILSEQMSLNLEKN